MGVFSKKNKKTTTKKTTTKKTNKKVVKKPNKTLKSAETKKDVLELIETQAFLQLKKLKSIVDSPEIIPKQYLDYIKDSLKHQVEEAEKRLKEQYTTGRPTKYKPSFCYDIIDYMAVGLDKHSVAIKLGIVYKNLLEWADKYPEFCNALNIGIELSKYWWKEQGRLNLYNKEFNATLFMMNMQNRFNWTRRLDGKLETKHTEELINTEKKVYEVNVNRTDAHKAEMLKILQETGALEHKENEDE